MTSLKFDVGFVRASCGELKEYLLSEQLYWTVPESSPAGEREFPKLTLGGLLLSVHRIQSRGQLQQIREEDMLIATTAQHWKTAWLKKIEREINTRTRTWVNYLGNLKENPHQEIDYYPYEVRMRVILELLFDRNPDLIDDYKAKFKEVDFWLKNVFSTGSFIWEGDLKGGFPEPHYWYLYGRPDIAKIQHPAG